MDQYYNYCHLDKYFSDTYEKKYPLMNQYYSEALKKKTPNVESLSRKRLQIESRSDEKDSKLKVALLEKPYLEEVYCM